jgi:hypothetical protein
MRCELPVEEWTELAQNGSIISPTTSAATHSRAYALKLSIRSSRDPMRLAVQ